MSCELLILKIMMSREKIPEPRNTHEKKKSWTHETPTIKNLGLKKYKRDKISDPRNTRQKEFWTHKIATRKNFEPRKYRHDILDPQNTNEKKFGILEIPTRKKFRTREIPAKKNFGPTKAQLRETHDGTRPTEFSTLNITLLLNRVSINLGTVNKHYVRKLTLIVAGNWVQNRITKNY